MYAIILALSLMVPVNGALLQHMGVLSPNQQQLWELPKMNGNVQLSVQASGTGQGDLDCYLLKPNTHGKGWIIADKDEDKVDSCTLGIFPRNDQPMRLWIVNHGDQPTSYKVVAKQ